MEREMRNPYRFCFSGFYFLLILVLYGGMVASSVEGSLVTHLTSPGTTVGGNPVSAKVTFTTTTDKVTVVLENLIVDQKSVAQNISGLYFSISTGQTAGTLVSSSGLLREIDSKGVYTDEGMNSTGWRLSTSGSQLCLNVLGTPAGPSHTIVGAPNSLGIYKNANNSITGNGPHNPFIAQSATFEIKVVGVTAASDISDIIFLFGTDGEPVHAPEPATLALVSLGTLGFLRLKRKLNS